VAVFRAIYLEMGFIDSSSDTALVLHCFGDAKFTGLAQYIDGWWSSAMFGVVDVIIRGNLSVSDVQVATFASGRTVVGGDMMVHAAKDRRSYFWVGTEHNVVTKHGPTGNFDTCFWTDERVDVFQYEPMRVLVQGKLSVDHASVEVFGSVLSSLGPIVIKGSASEVLVMHDQKCYLYATKRPGDKWPATHHSVIAERRAVVATAGGIDVNLGEVFAKGRACLLFGGSGVGLTADKNIVWWGDQDKTPPSGSLPDRTVFTNLRIPFVVVEGSSLSSGSGSSTGSSFGSSTGPNSGSSIGSSSGSSRGLGTRVHVIGGNGSGTSSVPKCVFVKDVFAAMMAVHEAAMRSEVRSVFIPGRTASEHLKELCLRGRASTGMNGDVRTWTDIVDTMAKTCLVAIFDHATTSFQPVLVVVNDDGSEEVTTGVHAPQGSVALRADGVMHLQRVAIHAQDNVTLHSRHDQTHKAVSVASAKGSIHVASFGGDVKLGDDLDVERSSTVDGDGNMSTTTTTTSVPSRYSAPHGVHVRAESDASSVTFRHVVVGDATPVVDVHAGSEIHVLAGTSHMIEETTTTKSNVIHTAVRHSTSSTTTRHPCQFPSDAKVTFAAPTVVVEHVEDVPGIHARNTTYHHVEQFFETILRRSISTETSTKTRTLNAAPAALIGIGVGYATAGLGANLCGLASASLSGAAASAAVSAAASTAAVEAAAGFTPGAGTRILEGAAFAGVTAGMSAHVCPYVPDVDPRLISGAVRAVGASVVGKSVQSEILGSTVGLVQGQVATELGTCVDRVAAVAGHAALGAAAGAVLCGGGGGSIPACIVGGAVGAAVAETVAEGVDCGVIGQMAGVVAARAVGGDVAVATATAQTAVAYNFSAHAHRYGDAMEGAQDEDGDEDGAIDAEARETMLGHFHDVVKQELARGSSVMSAWKKLAAGPEDEYVKYKLEWAATVVGRPLTPAEHALLQPEFAAHYAEDTIPAHCLKHIPKQIPVIGDDSPGGGAMTRHLGSAVEKVLVVTGLCDRGTARAIRRILEEATESRTELKRAKQVARTISRSHTNPK
jgi:hypothetical protein